MYTNGVWREEIQINNQCVTHVYMYPNICIILMQVDRKLGGVFLNNADAVCKGNSDR